MHVFQPLKAHEIEFNPFTIGGKYGVCITAEKGKDLDTCVISNLAFGKAWGKDAVTVLVRDNSLTKSIIDRSDFFSLTFFEDKYMNTLKYLKSVSGRDEDKIHTAGVTINRKLDIPYLDDGNMVILCAKIAEEHPSEDTYLLPYFKEKYYKDNILHTIVVGEVLEIMAR